jgi:transcriptional regulator with XRE-family HTH domain
MPSTPLQNHLIANRKRLALSQGEVAFLLGVQSSAKISRNERFVREPNLTTAFAYEVIYQRSASELFRGLYQQVEEDVLNRAHILAQRTKPPKKRRILEKIVTKQSLN